MKKALSLILVMILLFSAIPMTAGAADVDLSDAGADTELAETGDASGYCGENLTWVFDYHTRTLTISGEGAMDDFVINRQYDYTKPEISYSYDDGWYVIDSFAYEDTVSYPWFNCRGYINTVIVEDGVTHIGELAFYEMIQLKNVYLPETLKTIGDGAFRSCYSLEYIEIPYGVTSLGDKEGWGGALEFCNHLRTVVLPDTLSDMSVCCFFRCPMLTEIYLSNHVDDQSMKRICLGATLTWNPNIGHELTHFDVTIYTQKNSAADQFAAQKSYLHADYSAPFTVTYKANGGTGKMTGAKVYPGSVYRLRDCRYTAPEGKMFGGWSVNGTTYAPGDSVTINANTTVTALWVTKKPVVTFDPGYYGYTISDYYSEMEKTTLPYVGYVYTLPFCTYTPPQDTLRFSHWEIDGTYARHPGDKITVNEDITLKACWVDKNSCDSFLINFDPNGGSGVMKTVLRDDLTKYGVPSSLKLPECTFTPPSGGSFKGWELDGVLYQPNEVITVDSDIILKAIWQGTSLSILSCTVTAPYTGNTPAATAVSGNSSRYTAEVLEWYEGTQKMPSGEKFKGGKYYTVRIRFRMNDGYYTTSDTICLINGNTVKNTDGLICELTFNRLPGLIDAVDVTDVKLPVAGEKPSYYATISGYPGYTFNYSTEGNWKNSMMWYVKGARTNTLMTEDDTFTVGKQYIVQIDLTSNVGYGDYDFNTSGMTGTVNGKTGTVTGPRGSIYRERCYLTYTFTCVERTTLKGAEVTIDLPLHSEVLPFAATYPGNEGHRLFDNMDTSYGAVNGILWTDEDGNKLQPGDTVEKEKTYHLEIYLITVDNTYEFTKEWYYNSSTDYGYRGDYKINGELVTYSLSPIGQTCILKLDYTVPPIKELDKVDVTVLEPVVGYSPSYEATVPDDAGYRVVLGSGNGWYNGVLWQELGADGHVMSPMDKFVAGKEYRVSVSLETTSGGYRFKNSESYSNGTIPYVNGNVSEAVSSYGERSRGTLSYTFKSGVKTVGAVKLTGLSKPIPGKSAAANPPAGKTENAGVVIKEAKWSNLVPNPNNEGYYKYADFTGKFVEGTLYFPTYVLTTSEGYAFGNQVEVTLPSGKTQTINYISNNTITLYDAGVTATSKVTLIGDADGDGDVTILDATMIQRFLADLSVDSFDEAAADVDGDGDISILDATWIQRYLAEIENPYQIGDVIT